MGLFGPSKITITPHDFVKPQVDEIFSPKFIDAETTEFTRLTKETPIMQKLTFDKYLRERQNVIGHLFQIAWDRTIPYPIFIEYASIIRDDPRVKAIETGVYDRALSRAREAGMDTFGFISRVFLTQILPEGIDIPDADYTKLYVMYGTDFTSRYISFEALTKRYKFVT
jgi:hypothetical protein